MVSYENLCILIATPLPPLGPRCKDLDRIKRHNYVHIINSRNYQHCLALHPTLRIADAKLRRYLKNKVKLTTMTPSMHLDLSFPLLLW